MRKRSPPPQPSPVKGEGNTSRVGKGIGPLAAGLLLHTFFQTWLARAGYHFEEFRDLQVAKGLASGATLYGDMDWIYGPLHPYALHELFKMTGLPLEIMTVRYLGVALGAAGFFGAYAFARRLVSPGWSSFAAFLACWVFLPPRPTYNHHWAAAAALLWLPIAARYVERAGKGAAALMAIATSIACLSKPIPIGGALFILSLFVLLTPALTMLRSSPPPTPPPSRGRVREGGLSAGPLAWRESNAVQGFRGPDRGHRVISTATYLIVMLAGTVLPYAWVAGGSGWESIFEGLRPKTFQDEQIGFSLVPVSLRPSTFVSQWGRLLGGDPSGGWSGALAHLILLSDILAIGWGGYRVLRRLVGSRQREDIYYWILVSAALLLGCETLLFGRLMLIYGARAPMVLLLVILVTDFGHRLRGDQSNAVVRLRTAAKFFGMAVLSLPLIYLVGARMVPLASGTLGRTGATGSLFQNPHPHPLPFRERESPLLEEERARVRRSFHESTGSRIGSRAGDRFTEVADIPGMRGVRMSAEAVHFYESVLEEITSRSDQPGSVALWSYFPVVAFPLGARNIFSDRMHLFAHDLRTRTWRKGGPAITLLEEATRRIEEKKPALLVFLQHLSSGSVDSPEPEAATSIGGVRYRLVYSLTANVSANWIERALIFERELE